MEPTLVLYISFLLFVSGYQLVHFHNAVNFSDKPVAGKESNCSCQQEEADDHDARVSKIQEGWGRVLDV